MRLSIRSKLLCAFGVNVVLIVGLSIFAIVQMSMMNRSAGVMYEDAAPSIAYTDDILLAITKHQELQAEHIMESDPNEMERIEKEIAGVEAQVGAIMERFAPLMTNDEEKKTLERIRTEGATLVNRARKELLPASRGSTDTKDTARAIFISLEPTYDTITQLGVHLSDLQDQQTEEASRTIQSSYETSGILLLTITAIAIVFSSLLAFFLSRSITRNIGLLVTGASEVASGNLNTIVATRSTDELGTLTEAFNGMIVSLRSARETELQLRQTESELRQIETESRALLEHTVNDYLVFVQQVAQGDLRQRLEIQQEGVLGLLGQGLNSMVESLHTMTRQVQEANTAIIAAASEILAATTQQASSAAEQSAAISQTTTTIQEVKAIAAQTAQQAGQVAQDSQTALLVARQGAQAVEETVGGMAEIRQRVESIAQTILVLSEQTQAIGAITSTVSELADQSNLLALNAAIEAARAGEQGKSFAVVAQNVRELAERSKSATVQVREILGEIQKSSTAAVLVTEEGTKGAEAGGKLVTQAGQIIHRIAQEVESGAQFNVQMAAAAQQQTAGMEQIGQAMSNIQQATAQALASTRQAERAAQDLHNLAHSMQQTITVYQL